LQNLPEPSFIERDLEAIIERIKIRYEAKTGKTLEPMHPLMIFLESVAFEIYLQRIAFQDAAKQNLLDFARFPMLDWLGEYKKTPRLTNETNEKYKERIRKAPEKFSTCGPEGAYKQHVFSVSDDIIDVSIYSEPQSGVAELYILTKDKWTNYQLQHEKSLPEGDKTKIDGINLEVYMEELLAQIQFACSDKKVRPMTEKVEVYYPDIIEYEILADITLYKDAPPNMELLMNQIRNEAINFATEQEERFTPGVIISQIIDKLHLQGVYNLKLNSPAKDISLLYNQIVICANIEVQQVGVING